MNQLSTQSHKRRRHILNSSWFWISVVLVFLLIMISANAHLVLVAINSQPECVAHDKVADSSTRYLRAAKSAC